MIRLIGEFESFPVVGARRAGEPISSQSEDPPKVEREGKPEEMSKDFGGSGSVAFATI
jgi:hypothetical protein